MDPKSSDSSDEEAGVSLCHVEVDRSQPGEQIRKRRADSVDQDRNISAPLKRSNRVAPVGYHTEPNTDDNCVPASPAIVQTPTASHRPRPFSSVVPISKRLTAKYLRLKRRCRKLFGTERLSRIHISPRISKEKMVAGEVTPTIAPLPGSPISPGELVVDELIPQMEGTSVSPQSDGSEYFGPLVFLKVKDILGITPKCGILSLGYPPTATFAQLFRDVAAHFEISMADFELVYQDRMDLYELSAFPPTEPMTSANLVPSREKEYCITINGKKKGRKLKGRSASRNLNNAFNEDPENYSSAASGIHDPSLSETVLNIVPSKRDFVGLKNMNMTCYLNSVVQSLWFTPELRNLIYTYCDQIDRPRKKSICLPLQKLFLRLQFSTREAIETDELTGTFGWTNRDTWQQHDAEELCNLLMENLSAEFKGTELDGMVEALYFGTFNDYVKCLECERRNMRDAAFSVLPLPIRQFGQTLDNPTLEEALKVFTVPELLEGNNKYNCEVCSKPCDAHKGFLFKKLPYILTIQLKRFEFNWSTNRRSKLNDKIIFPIALDMNPYMDRSEVVQPCCADLKLDLIQPVGLSNEDCVRDGHSRPLVSLEESDANNSTKSTVEKSKESILSSLNCLKETQGPDIYQLFAVLVHRGGLTGGHYFSYILDFESYRWYRCDDSYVRKASFEDITASFGGDEEDKEPTSAYMLMYRRYDSKFNTLPFILKQMPQHIQELWKTMLESEQEAEEEEELEKNTIKMAIHYRPRGTWELTSSEMHIPKVTTTRATGLFLYKHFFPDIPEPPAERIRVSRFDEDTGIVENSFDGHEDQCITYALRNPPPVTKNEGLILELVGENERFYSYSARDFVFLAHLIDYKKDGATRVQEVHGHPMTTILDLKKSVAEIFGLALEKVIIILHLHEDKVLIYLSENSALLGNLGIAKINYIFVQSVEAEEVGKFMLYLNGFIHCRVYDLEIEKNVEPATDNTLYILDNIDVRIDAFEDLPSIGIQLESTEALGGSPRSDVTLELSPIRSNDAEPVEALGGSPRSDVTVELSPTRSNDMEPVEPSGQGLNLTIESNSVELVELSPSSDAGKVVAKQVDEAVNTPPEIGGEVEVGIGSQELTPQREYRIKLFELTQCERWRCCSLNVDTRMLLSTFSKNFAQIVGIPETDFILSKLVQGEEKEVLDYNQPFVSLNPCEKLRLRFLHRLQTNEGRVAVYTLDLNHLDTCTFIGDVVLNLEMSSGEAKEAIFAQCPMVELVGTTNCRLRKKHDGTPSRIFRTNTKVSDYFIHGFSDSEIYLQLFEAGSMPSLEKYQFPVIIRWWRPSTWTLDAIVEVTIFYDHTVAIENVILPKLIEVTGIPEIEIEVVRPDVQFPYDMNPLAIQELVWFPLNTPSKKCLYVYNDDIALYVRDKREELKPWSVEEEINFRKEIEDVNMGYRLPIALSSPKKEAGLRINLNRTPTKT